MRPFSQTIFMLLLNRLQSKPSTQFTQSFVLFFTSLCASDNVGPDFAIGVLDAIQPGYAVPLHCASSVLTLSSLFGQLLQGVVLSNTQKAPFKNRKPIEIGLVKLLSKSDAILAGQNTQYWSITRRRGDARL